MAKPVSASPTWEQLLGSTSWTNMLDPLDLELRKFLLRCGNFVQAAYDGNTNTPRDNNSLYPKESLFAEVGLTDASRYRIHSYLYATSGINTILQQYINFSQPANPDTWGRSTNWIGYVAYGPSDQAINSTGQLEIYVVIRGTMAQSEWTSNIAGARLVSIDPLLTSRAARGLFSREPSVHEGWLAIYNAEANSSGSLRNQIKTSVDDLIKRYKNAKPSIVVTGHSLGGALTTLCSFDLAANKVVAENVLVSAITFSSPQVGNQLFLNKVGMLPNLKILQVKNWGDLVPNTPDGNIPIFVPIQTAELVVQAVKSPFLNKLRFGPAKLHNLELLLHLVAGWNGQNGNFKLQVQRNHNLVNKSTDLLNDTTVLPNWWSNRKELGFVFDKNAQEWVKRLA